MRYVQLLRASCFLLVALLLVEGIVACSAHVNEQETSSSVAQSAQPDKTVSASPSTDGQAQPQVTPTALPPAMNMVTGAAKTGDNPIVFENQQPGTDQWQIGIGNFKSSDDKTQQVKGYASATSVNKGNSITFYVTVNPTQTYTIDIYRMGWYGGKGGRLLHHVDPINGVTQPTCPIDATTGLIACAWAASYTLNVPTTWTDGVYIALLTNDQQYRNYIIFVVRDDSRVADLIYQQPVTTYQAYNSYPDDKATGKSLYEFNSYGANTVTKTKRAARVSFDRPYSSTGWGQFGTWELNFIRWLEKSGYDVTYITDLDTHANGDRLTQFKGFLSVGHDEYWSKEMRDAVEKARDAGVNLGFFGANACYWQVRFEPSAQGVPLRVMVSYKIVNEYDVKLDPIQTPALKTGQWRSPVVNRPEQSLVGVQFTAEVQNQDGAATVPYIVNNSANWVYAGTGFKDGDAVPGIVGYEADRFMSEFGQPAGSDYTLLSHSPFTSTNKTPDYSNSSIYHAPSGAWVFASGTMSWSWALDNYGSHNFVDPRIQRTTANILNTFVSASNK